MRKVIVLSAAGLLLGGCLVPKDQYEAMSREAQTRGQQKEAAEANAAALEKRLGELQAELQKSQDDKATLEKQLADEQAEKNGLIEQNNQLSALNAELSTNTKKLEEAKAELEKKSASYEQLAQSLKGEISAGKVELTELKGRMTVKMKDKILFSSGSATLGKEGEAALDKVAKALQDVEGKIIRVEGHTDSDPVDPKGNFKSNWELSVARAMAVVQRLQDQGVDPTKLSVAGYGQFQPIAPNKTPEQKSRNRRIEIVLAPATDAPPGLKKPAAKTAKND